MPGCKLGDCHAMVQYILLIGSADGACMPCVHQCRDPEWQQLSLCCFLDILNHYLSDSAICDNISHSRAPDLATPHF
jgi:hypothetical protein